MERNLVDQIAEIPGVISVEGVYEAFERYELYFDMFSDPNRALQAFAKAPHGYALIVVDIRMPGMNGVELAMRIRQICPDIQVLFMTAYLAEEMHTVPEGSIYKKDI